MNQSVKRIDVKGPHGIWSWGTPSVMVVYLRPLMHH